MGTEIYLELDKYQDILEKHFGISKNMKVRVSNWNKRPLSDKMLAYAAKDVAYLQQSS